MPVLRSHLASGCRLGLVSLLVICQLGPATTLAGPGPAGHAPQGQQRQYPQPGGILSQLPPGHQRFRLGDRDYHFHQGIFYRPDPGGWRIVRPPLGLVIGHLPPGCETRLIAGRTYFFFAEVWYQRVPTGYIVVQAPATETTVQPVVQGPVIMVDTDVLNVRSGPGLDQAIVGQVTQGTQLNVIGSAPNWYYVRLPNGQNGWVLQSYTHPITSGAKG